MQKQAENSGIDKLASAAQRLHAVRRAQREFLALWALDALGGVESAVGRCGEAAPDRDMPKPARGGRCRIKDH